MGLRFLYGAHELVEMALTWLNEACGSVPLILQNVLFIIRQVCYT